MGAYGPLFIKGLDEASNRNNIYNIIIIHQPTSRVVRGMKCKSLISYLGLACYLSLVCGCSSTDKVETSISSRTIRLQGCPQANGALEVKGLDGRHLDGDCFKIPLSKTYSFQVRCVDDSENPNNRWLVSPWLGPSGKETKKSCDNIEEINP